MDTINHDDISEQVQRFARLRSIITVSAGPDECRTAISDQGIEELRDFIADFRRSPEHWDQLLHSIIDDPKIIDAVKAHKPR